MFYRYSWINALLHSFVDSSSFPSLCPIFRWCLEFDTKSANCPSKLSAPGGPIWDLFFCTGLLLFLLLVSTSLSLTTPPHLYVLLVMITLTLIFKDGYKAFGPEKPHRGSGRLNRHIQMHSFSFQEEIKGCPPEVSGENCQCYWDSTIFLGRTISTTVEFSWLNKHSRV